LILGFFFHHAIDVSPFFTVLRWTSYCPMKRCVSLLSVFSSLSPCRRAWVLLRPWDTLMTVSSSIRRYPSTFFLARPGPCPSAHMLPRVSPRLRPYGGWYLGRGVDSILGGFFILKLVPPPPTLFHIDDLLFHAVTILWFLSIRRESPMALTILSERLTATRVWFVAFFRVSRWWW